MNTTQTHIFDAKKADRLDGRLRRFFQNPLRILSPHVGRGMTVLDYGCGNGYFTVPLSGMVGSNGKVYAVDIQAGMLEKLKIKLNSHSITNVHTVLKQNNTLRLPESVDFAVAVYVVHEIPDKYSFFEEMFDLLKPDGKLLIMEPDLIVSAQAFKKTIEIARQTGFVESEKLNLLLSKTRILLKEKRKLV